MPNKFTDSTKKALIDKANSRIVLLTSVAAFVFVFCAVAVKTLASQAGYQNRVIAAKEEARDQLKEDLEAINDLEASYNSFTNATQNVLGGNASGAGPLDGNNAKLVLDALPSAYDFPALATSLEKLIALHNLQIVNISGTDDEVAQSANTSSSAPEPVAMPFDVSVSGSYDNIKGLLETFERSIRPIQIESVDIAGSQGNLTLNVKALTYYQPAKSLNITSKVVE